MEHILPEASSAADFTRSHVREATKLKLKIPKGAAL